MSATKLVACGINDSDLLLSGRDLRMDGGEWREFVDGLKQRWKALWQERIDDKLRAEGIASEDYKRLFVEQGTVIVATRDYAPPRFGEIVARHAEEQQLGVVVVPHPVVGGWGKFARDILSQQRRLTQRGRPVPSEPVKKRQQRKKGGKGWLHFRPR